MTNIEVVEVEGAVISEHSNHGPCVARETVKVLKERLTKHF